jgi:Planctomycete cytochrome C
VAQSCGVGAGTGCHGTDGRKGMLGMFTQEDAYQGLVGGVGGHARVIPMDPSCSILMERLNATDPAVRMPYLSTQLAAPDRCAVQQWIAQGAAK